MRKAGLKRPSRGGSKARHWRKTNSYIQWRKTNSYIKWRKTNSYIQWRKTNSYIQWRKKFFVDVISNAL